MYIQVDMYIQQLATCSHTMLEGQTEH